MKRDLKIPVHYEEQNGCHNCEHCFTKLEYDEYPQYFCNLDTPPRPKCGSVLMDESYLNLETDKEYDDAEDAWSKWADGRGTRAWGVCLSWRILPNSTEQRQRK